MYSTTELFNNAICDDNRTFTARIKVEENASTDSIKKIQLYSQNTSSDCITVGGAFSSYVKLELWKPGFLLEGKEFQLELGLEVAEGEIEWCSLGYFTTDSIKTSFDGMITITAYDRIYSKFAGAYFSKLTYPIDAIEILKEISQLTGVEIDTSGLSTGVIVEKRKVITESEFDEEGNTTETTTYENPFDGYTYNETLGYIAMLYCKYAIVDQNGKVKLVWYQSEADRKFTTDEFFSDLETAELAFSVGSIVCNTGEQELKSGTGDNNIILENPVMTQERLDFIYEKVKKMSFIPLTMSAYGDIRLEIGDMVLVEKNPTTIYSVPIMSIVQEFDGGLKTTIQSYGGSNEEKSSEGPLLNRLERQYAELLFVKTLIGQKASFESLKATDAELKTLTSDFGDFKNLTADNFKATYAWVTSLDADNIKTNTLRAEIAKIGVLTADEINAKYATIDNLTATNGKIDKLASISITTENLEAETAKFGYLNADEAEIKYAKIETLETDYLKLKDLKAETAKLGYLDADEIVTRYAKIDFSNVGTQVVSSSMIVDGSVTNEKVGNLSADKITSGTIDASKITVTNLNADNLTVGTINGKLIGNGSVDLDKLSEEVPTKEYLDKVQNELQGQIDGAIETFTKTETPTLNNEPASLWTDNATKKKHVGDICYVVNPISSADGYCYRFADLGTASSPSYSWVLIKDSDVTKALQDIIDIHGEITGIKKFDNEISSWKTDTNQELSSLKSRTTTLETDMGTKVENSVFNTLKQTVDNNSSNITSLSNTVKTKADGSMVTELTNTVNDVKQTVDANSLSISSMKSEIKNKADGSTVTEMSERTTTIEQDLAGFKTTVANTYTTKEDSNKTDAKVTSLETRVSQTESKITSQASSINDQGSKISTLEQTAEGFTAQLKSTNDKVSAAQTKADDAWSTALGAAKTATNYLNFSEEGLVVGDMTTEELGRNVRIDSDSVDIRNGEDTLASFAEDLIELGNNNRNATIRLLKGLLEIIASANTNPLIGDNAIIASLGTLTLELKGLSNDKYADVRVYKTPSAGTAFDGTVDVNAGIGAGSADTSSSVTSYEDSAVLRTSGSEGSYFAEMSSNLFDGDSKYCPNVNSRVIGSNGSTRILQYDDHVEFYKNSTLMAKYNGSNKTLWTGPYIMSESHTATLSEAISKQPNGIVLAFSKYLSDNPSNAYYWNMFFIPKSMVSISGGRVMVFPMFETKFGNPGTKALYITDTTIKGNADNTSSGTANGVTYKNGNYVLRAVIGV